MFNLILDFGLFNNYCIFNNLLFHWIAEKFKMSLVLQNALNKSCMYRDFYAVNNDFVFYFYNHIINIGALILEHISEIMADIHNVSTHQKINNCRINK